VSDPSDLGEPGGHPRNRRIDRVLDAAYVEGLADLSLDDLRARRDDCLAEREYLSMLRRLLQGRAEILQAELEARGSGEERAPLVERLTAILADDEHPTTSRGELVRVSVPEEEMLLARRRVERMVADVGLSDPSGLDDERLAEVVEMLAAEEQEVSSSRRAVIGVLDTLQEELKRRYRDDPTLALR
jgi:hypothetical protein